jgi:seryl-tRNA synthetase
LLAEVETLKQRNRASKEIGALMGQKKPPRPRRRKKTRELGDRIAALDKQVGQRNARDQLMLRLPNLPHESVKIGKTAEDNPVVRVHGEKAAFAFKPKSHVELCEIAQAGGFCAGDETFRQRFFALHELGRAAGAGADSNAARFAHGRARLHGSVAAVRGRAAMSRRRRAVSEIQGPVLRRGRRATTTGELGKLYLVPTAETPVANIHREEILKESQLPVYYCAYTPCFRGEAGAAGVGTRGMIRVHQFDKVELIKIVKPEHGYEEQEKMVANAEKVLQLLGLHYRVVLLCTGDMGFASAKTYDIEVWAPGQGSYLEVSSCSNCEDFQARRMNLRFKTEAGENKFPHILNGSGTALARLFVALIETHQQADGSVLIPRAAAVFENGAHHCMNRLIFAGVRRR